MLKAVVATLRLRLPSRASRMSGDGESRLDIVFALHGTSEDAV